MVTAVVVQQELRAIQLLLLVVRVLVVLLLWSGKNEKRINFPK
jgi:hypothetical protein